MHYSPARIQQHPTESVLILPKTPRRSPQQTSAVTFGQQPPTDVVAQLHCRADTKAMEQPLPLAGSYRPSAETSSAPPGTFPIQAGQVASETNPMGSAGMLYLFCKSTRSGSLCSITCHLCIWKTSAFTFNLTFNHQPHLQPLPSALPHFQSHLQPHLLPFFLTLHIRRHSSR